MSVQPLLFLRLGLKCQIHDVATKGPSGEALLADQQRQEVGHWGAEQEGEFRSGATSQRIINQGNQGIGKGAVLREADGTIEPQAVGVKPGGLAQGVVAGIVVEASEVPVLLQSTEHRHVGCVQGGAELSQSGNGAVLEMVKDRSLLRG